VTHSSWSGASPATTRRARGAQLLGGDLSDGVVEAGGDTTRRTKPFRDHDRLLRREKDAAFGSSPGLWRGAAG
jgi:hypothetical protein